jgi:hypothetical protein
LRRSLHPRQIEQYGMRTTGYFNLRHFDWLGCVR